MSIRVHYVHNSHETYIRLPHSKHTIYERIHTVITNLCEKYAEYIQLILTKLHEQKKPSIITMGTTISSFPVLLKNV